MIAYNKTFLKNLEILKESKRWLNAGIIDQTQFTGIVAGHAVQFYHPNFIIRILLFIATIVAMAGVSGIFGLIFFDALEDSINGVCIFYGIISWIFLEVVFINKRHYKSGVTEALLYHSMGWLIGGLAGSVNFDETWLAFICVVVFSISAIRYADLLSTIAATFALAFLVFDILYSAGGTLRQIIPFAFIIIFSGVFLLTRRITRNEHSFYWDNNLTILEALSLLIVYAAGNYFVVRELSVNMMQLDLSDGQDIPFAWIFYILTVVVPVGYLYVAIKKKDLVLLRASLVAVAFSVFTFKYYFSLGHPEITLTISGAVLLAVSLSLFRYLKTPKHGYTRESILKEKWTNANIEGFVFSQTLGGNKSAGGEPVEAGAGGTSTGGGASDAW